VNEQTVFAEALERTEPRDRAAFLDQACQADPALRARIERLLAQHEHGGHFLESPPQAPQPTVDAPTSERPGTVIGPYKVLEQIGEGGFGVVFMAEQQRPVRRKVALKVLKPGMDTRQVIARFEAERQALALMDHPHIAHVFDGGETASGRPYFVMELVRGIPITDFCDQSQMPVRDRLELFLSVCQAVQHAHQKGIIHRDLKPSNILVTMHDDKPVAKVIDFGIAKATGQQLTDKTLFTNFAQLIGTPLYMSPEQAQMSGLDVDTRSDIYSLGVLLYELLTGTTPFDRQRLDTAAYDEIRRIIREEEPPRPSTRVTTPNKNSAGASAKRKSDAKQLRQLFRGELDWIVMKALEKDRNRRYETASSFAADVQRYLHDEPVLACPPSTWYRVRKVLRRHKGAALAVSLVALALMGGIIGTTSGMLRATSAEDVAVKEADAKEHALQDREAALVDAKEQLFLALVSQARAARTSGQVGQRFAALRAIRQAAQIRMTPQLRTEAMAALVLPDVEVVHEWEGWPAEKDGLRADAALERYARADREGRVTVCRRMDVGEEVLARLPAHGKPPFGTPIISPDGRFVAFAHSAVEEGIFRGVRVWKLDGPEPEVLLDEPNGMSVVAYTFHASSRLLALGHANNTVSIYDLASGQRVRRLAVGALPVHLAFHPRDNRLAVASGNRVQLFDTDTGRALPPLRHPPAADTQSVAWHPDGRRLAVGCDDRTIHLWDTQTATELMPAWTGHSVAGIQLGFNHAGDRLVSTDWGGQTRLWDVATGRLLLTMPGTFGLQFSPDDRWLGLGKNGSNITLARLADGRELRALRRRNADSQEVIANPVVHGDGRTLAASSPDWLSVFDLASGEELGSVRLPYQSAAYPAFFDPQVGWMTGGHGGVFFWPASPVPARPEVLSVGPARHLAPGLASAYAVGTRASPDGLVVAVPTGASTIVLHRDHPERRQVLGPQYDVRFAAVSPDRRWVVTCSHWSDGRSKSTRIWDAGTGKQIRELPLEGSTYPQFSPDGRWLLTVNGGSCQLWEAGSWQVRRFDGRAATFSPNSQLLALINSFSVVQLIEATTGREVARLTGPEPMWYAPACFTPDGTRLIAYTSEGKALYVWDLRLIRQQLKELGLDWDWPEFAPPEPARRAGTFVKAEILLGDLAQPLPREQKARQDIDQYRRAVAAKPNDAKACNALAWTYLTAPEALRDVKAALPLAEKAAGIDNANAVYRNTLGLAYYRSARYREAVDVLRRNLETQESWALAFDLYILTMSHHKLGETTRAQDYFDLAGRWQQTARGLSAGHLEELSWFRAEAELVVREKEKKK
jgi:serine/threonine protein kinase/WD40 repeat protein